MVQRRRASEGGPRAPARGAGARRADPVKPCGPEIRKGPGHEGWDPFRSPLPWGRLYSRTSLTRASSVCVSTLSSGSLTSGFFT